MLLDLTTNKPGIFTVNFITTGIFQGMIYGTKKYYTTVQYKQYPAEQYKYYPTVQHKKYPTVQYKP